jgi:NDP-sugar pyrophosphorylase family protein
MTLQPHISQTTPALIMAGGLGTRLRPLTVQTPKPMVRVGGKPLLEILIDQLRQEGVVEIFLAVHYRKEDIQNYFRDGETFGVHIRLAHHMLHEPFFVINGDVLTKVRFLRMMSRHKDERHAFTIASAIHTVEIPYGIVEVMNRRVTEIREKPVYQMLVNAGIYCMNPEVISLIPEHRCYDMTQLIERLLEDGHSVGSYPMREYWLDVGQLPDYEKAAKDYPKWFGPSQDAAAGEI